jgi:site-specific DNA-methyltransferase (adenine-specific)
LFRDGDNVELRVGRDGKRFAVRVVDWDEATEKAANITANNPHIAGTFTDGLEALLAETKLAIGNEAFCDLELDALMAEVAAPVDVKEDEVSEPPEEPVTKPGDIWILGENVLVCGDSTDPASYSRLSNRAALTVTSPPYNALATGNTMPNRQKYLAGGDDLKDDDYYRLIADVLRNCMRNSHYVFYNIQMLAGNKISLARLVWEHRERLAEIMVWDKITAEPSMPDNVLNSRFEFVFVFSDKGNRRIGTAPFRGTIENLFALNSRQGKEYSRIHKATYPVQFAAHLIGKFCCPGDFVVEPFCGTGTTLVAAEQLERRCFGIEIEPRYCDVIIERWQTLTGGKATRVSQ